MDQTKQDSGFTSISVSKSDYAQYDALRKEFAETHGIPEKKVSVAMILNVGMTFYKQRKNFVKKVDRDEQGRFLKEEQSSNEA